MKRAPSPPAESPPQKADASSPTPSPDVALIHGVTPDGGLRILRRRGDRIEMGAAHPVREGVPIHGELIALKPREACPLICDVEVQYAPPRAASAKALVSAPAAAPQRKGPARVSSEAYRENWDSIWSRAKKDTALN